MRSENTIFFNSRDPEHGWLSNFFEAEFIINGVKWKTVEHYFQASKFLDRHYAERIKDEPLASKVKIMGRSRLFPIDPQWDSKRMTVMEEGVRGKFFQNAILGIKLIETKDAELVEYGTRDNFWGSNLAKTGKNKLGIILMKIRDELISR